MKEWDDMVLVGRVARAHGNKGQIIVDPATDFPEERFKPGAVLCVRHDRRIDALTVENVRFQRGRPILGLAGIATIDGAELLAGSELRISADALHALPPGSFYHHDLVGCAVRTREGDAIGTVTGVEGDAAGSRLIVQGRSGEVLIPLAEDICVDVNVLGRTIIVQPIEGLLDLNVTKRVRT